MPIRNQHYQAVPSKKVGRRDLTVRPFAKRKLAAWQVKTSRRWRQGSKNWPPSGHFQLKHEVWRVKNLLIDSLATENCCLADRLATKLFFKRTTPVRTERDRARSVAVFQVWPSKMQESWPLGPYRSCLWPNAPTAPGTSLGVYFRDNLSLVGQRKYRTRFDCRFARHIRHPDESFSVRVWAEKVPQCMGRD